MNKERPENESDWEEVEIKKVSKGTTPNGSEWARITVPDMWQTKGYRRWAMKDLVQVPENLPMGQYILSFRY